MNGFADKFAYAVEVARLRDGLQGDTEELRSSSSSDELERVLDSRGRDELVLRLRSTKGSRIPKGGYTVEAYNQAWAESYLAQVDRGESP